MTATHWLVITAWAVAVVAFVIWKSRNGLVRARFDRHAEQALAVGNDEDGAA